MVCTLDWYRACVWKDKIPRPDKALPKRFILPSVINPSSRASKPDKSITAASRQRQKLTAVFPVPMSQPDAPLPDEKRSQLTAGRDQPIDLSLYLHGSIGEKRRVARALLNSLRINGFARLRNHGIKKSVIIEAFHFVNRHFSRRTFRFQV